MPEDQIIDQPKSLTIPAAMIADLPGDTMSQLDTGKAYRVWLETWAVSLRQMKAAIAEPREAVSHETISEGIAGKVDNRFYREPDPQIAAAERVKATHAAFVDAVNAALALGLAVKGNSDVTPSHLDSAVRVYVPERDL